MVLGDFFLLMGSLLVLIVCVLIGVAFLTLLERKVLGYIQIRKGPNKVGFMGLLQPFGDAVKLFCKEQSYPIYSNFFVYYFSPVLNLLISLFLWVVMPFFTGFFNFNFSFIFFLSVSSLGVYSIMLAGWSSNSFYSLLGGLRAVAQSISYEVSLALILMSFIFLTLSFNLLDFFYYQDFMWFVFFCFPLSVMWLITGLAETNRTPFDFAEGESELVSGFNVEYSSGSFAMIFLAEYASILLMSMLSVTLFMGSEIFGFIFFVKLVFLSFFWVWVRGAMPRFRYDKLMYLAWKSFLPSSLNFLLMYFGVKIFIFTLLL
uniref:NADH-ubiquinone oxidoreductase chain 1 n=1 Tax=Scaphidema metallicum TaxID=1586539 RepID=A0A343C3P3_9CUCU|nr:NADH dehydrogenase subunit 1 [Scaphidema metallicum]